MTLFPDAVNAHGHTVGHFFTGQVQHLFTDLLRQKQALRLITDSVGRVKRGSLRQALAQALHQLLTANTTQGAEAEERTITHQATVATLQFCSPFGGDQVLLVETDHQSGGTVPQQLNDVGIPMARRHAAVHEQQHQIHLANG